MSACTYCLCALSSGERIARHNSRVAATGERSYTAVPRRPRPASHEEEIDRILDRADELAHTKYRGRR